MNRVAGRSLRLRGRIFGTYLIAIVLTQIIAVLYAFLTQFTLIDDGTTFLSRQYGIHFAPFFVENYTANGDWGSVEETADMLVDNPFQDELPSGLIGPLGLFDLSPAFQLERVIVFDTAGDLVLDTDPSAEPFAADDPFAVTLTDPAGAEIGSLIIESGYNAGFAQGVRRAILRIAISISLLAVVVSSVLSWVFSARLSLPLRKLRDAAVDLAESNDVDHIPVTRGDEVGELTEIFNDMAGRVQHQRNLRQQMVADIAHELRTPLSIMQLELSSMIDGMQNPAEAGASMLQEIDALQKLIGDLNLLSKTDAQELELHPIELDAADFLIQATRQWEQPARQHGTTITLSLPYQDEVLIKADERRLYQILNNLVINAMRYGKGDVPIDVALKVMNAHAQFQVRDYGPGIPPEDIPNLFDRFFRAKGTAEVEGGSGLGLAISKRLVELHGGRIWCESELGKGSLFVVELALTELK